MVRNLVDSSAARAADGFAAFASNFEIRYIAPVAAGFTILGAAGLGFAPKRIRNLASVAIASAMVSVAVLFHLYHQPFDLWRRIARAVDTPSQTIFFEAGYVMSVKQAAGLDPDSLVEVLPDGYLRIPFDYYFGRLNPRRKINPFRPELARETIAQSARRDGGAWLVSHLDAETTRPISVNHWLACSMMRDILAPLPQTDCLR